MSKNISHGEFYVYYRNNENSYKRYVCSPLTQHEISEGWVQVLPRRTRNNETFHFNVTLTELPFHLWNKLRVDYDENGKERYKNIKNNIYSYTVKKSNTDDMAQQLYRLVFLDNPNKDRIQKLVTKLESHKARGWLLLKAKEMCM